MITKSMKISKMLKDYPQTIDILLKTSPHFSKLKNKILRKALAARVNVEQAAAIAGVDISALLYRLNKSVNPIAESQIVSANTKKEKHIMEENDFNFINNLNPDKIIILDVRPIIDTGKDPFLEIMSKVKALKEDDIFLLINSFEPIPLYSVMGKKGFDYKIIKEEEVYKIYFFKNNVPASSTGENTENGLTSAQIPHNYENIIEIDVRELTPPEPMVKVLEALSKVDYKTVLVVHHHREPLMLYPKLEERGYKAISNKINDNYFKVIIMKKMDKA
ncbi:MAG: DUF2249 domain-containing protein [Ignavibacteriaceae bacterium]